MSICIGRNDMVLSGFLGSDPEPLKNKDGEIFAYQVDIADSSRSRYDDEGNFHDKTQWETVKYYKGKNQSMEKFQKFGLGKKGDLLYIPSSRYITDTYTDPETGNPRRFSYFRIKTYLPFIPKSIYELYWDRGEISEEKKLANSEKEAMRAADSQSSNTPTANTNQPPNASVSDTPTSPLLTGKEEKYDAEKHFSSSETSKNTETVDPVEELALKIHNQWLKESADLLNGMKPSKRFIEVKRLKDEALKTAKEQLAAQKNFSNTGSNESDLNRMIQQTADEKYNSKFQENNVFLSALNSEDREAFCVELWKESLEEANAEFSQETYKPAAVNDSELDKIKKLARG